MATEKTLTSVEDYEDNPSGLASLWSNEMTAAEKDTKKWLLAGIKITDTYLDERGTKPRSDHTKLNLFTSNIQTLESMLFGQMPAIDVKRRDNDQDDDVARVAARIVERLLNNDVQRDGDSYADCLRYSLQDRMLPGLGCARVRYEAEFEEVVVEPLMSPAPPDGGEQVELAPGYTEDRKVWEDAVVDYVHWKDVRWSPARVWGEVRWLAFRSHMTKDQMTKRFGKKIAAAVQYGTPKRKSVIKTDALNFDPWGRCEVWEIWSKADRKVIWWVDGHDETLDSKTDPLELEEFWPCPKFLMANLTTSSFVPRADYSLHQDLYKSIDELTTRISWLEKAVKAVGVYDKSQTGIKRMLEEGFENDLIPVDNWAAFAEQGGIQGTVSWMPIMDVVSAMDKLRDVRKENIDLLYQVSGMSDIMRGASTMPNVTATEQGIKARFASVRVTALQDQFAEFATGLQQLKAEIIVKHFDDETIIERSNIEATKDGPYVAAAMAMLRGQFAEYKIEILPDNIARADFASTKNDRSEYLTSVGGFISQVLPFAEKMPGSLPMLVQMIQWVSAGFRGGSEMETVMDQAYQQLTEAAKNNEGQPKQPSPEQIKAQAEEKRSQARIQEAQVKAQSRMAELQAKSQSDMQKLQQEHQNAIMEIQVELQADIKRESSQARFNVVEHQQKNISDMEGEAFERDLPPPRQAGGGQ